MMRVHNLAKHDITKYDLVCHQPWSYVVTEEQIRCREAHFNKILQQKRDAEAEAKAKQKKR